MGLFVEEEKRTLGLACSCPSTSLLRRDDLVEEDALRRRLAVQEHSPALALNLAA
jgi:hypothetical protein